MPALDSGFQKQALGYIKHAKSLQNTSITVIIFAEFCPPKATRDNNSLQLKEECPVHMQQKLRLLLSDYKLGTKAEH